MALKRLFIILTFSTILATSTSGQRSTIIPKEFVETVPSKVGNNEWIPLNHSQNEFGVSIAKGKLVIKKVREVNKCDLKIIGGTLIGINNGEWGGQLTFKPEDSTKESVEIKQGNIKFLFNFKNKIYFIESLAHLNYSGGAIFELTKTDNSFTYTKLVEFDDAPEAFAIYRDKFLIATHKSFYLVQDFKKELIFKDTFWKHLYPNSIAALDDKNVFIGMRGGITKLDLTNKTLKFFKND